MYLNKMAAGGHVTADSPRLPALIHKHVKCIAGSLIIISVIITTPNVFMGLILYRCICYDFYVPQGSQVIDYESFSF